MMKFIDLTGQKINRLLILERVKSKDGKNTFWKCQCNCGNIIVTTTTKIRSGHTKSCGCYTTDLMTTHGLSYTRLHGIWNNLKQRCFNPNSPNFKYYGGRGITVCDEWKNDFKSFYDWAMSNGYEEHLTLDRIHSNGNYEPFNCRWTTMKEQSNNVRTNHIIEFNGEKHTLAEWSEIRGISKKTLWNRIDRGWTVERALTTPIKTKKV
jgi:hypothetical protein